MTLAGISIRRPVATIMVMISIIFIVYLQCLAEKELLPEMNVPVVTVSTTCQGQ